MKSKILTFISLFILASPLLFAQPTDEELQLSVDNGVAWLVAQQNPDGSWGSGEQVAYTGFVMTKLSDYAIEHGTNPLDVPAIVDGFNYLMGMAFVHGPGISISPGAPCYHHETYNAAVALMALANLKDPGFVISSTNPVVNGKTIMQVMTEMVTFFEYSQHSQGGWTYNECENAAQDADNSHTGYVVLALRYAEDAGVAIPPTLKSNLDSFIDLIQDDVTGESYYRIGWAWPNALKQGNLLLEMSFVGDDVTDARDQAALDFLATLWDNPSPDPGWRDPQAMYCLMKGFESFGIETITVASVERDWFAEFAGYLLSIQLPDGSWPPAYWADPVLSTCWSLLVLEKVAPPPPFVLVDLDIHPTSWPNPINKDSKGVIPVAILGTEDFDVSQIDPASLMLEGVSPLRWAMDDVGTPVEHEAGCNATELGPDGFMDLTLKFKTQELVAAIGPLNVGDELVLELTGLTLDGKDIVGDDCVIIVGNKSASLNTFEYSLSQNYPNPFGTNTQIVYELAEKSHVRLSVFNIMGQEVETIVNNTQQPGYYYIDFNGVSLPSGQYFYRLTTPKFVDTKLMNIVH